MIVSGRLDFEALQGDALEVARRLLGARLVRVADGVRRSGRIVETEAYRADDPAAHSFRGQTPRNRSMFGPPGLAYVYFTYGSCFCVNVVCEPAGVGAAVLVRALEPEEGLDAMAAARGRDYDLANGPGRLCQALGIDRELDGVDLLAGRYLFLEAGEPIPESLVARTPRIGISQAQDWPWRFALLDNKHVSRPISSRKRAVDSRPISSRKPAVDSRPISPRKPAVDRVQSSGAAGILPAAQGNAGVGRHGA